MTRDRDVTAGSRHARDTVTDADLFERWRDGDTVAGDRFVRIYYPRLFGFFSGRLSHEVAQDLVQDTFVALLRPSTQWQQRASISTFVLAVARHKLLDYLRQNYRRSDAQQDGFDSAQHSLAVVRTSLSSVAARRERRWQLLEAIATLPDDTQLMIELCYGQEQSAQEIAAILDITPEAVRSRLFRARKQLGQRLMSMFGEVLSEGELQELRAAA